MVLYEPAINITHLGHLEVIRSERLHDLLIGLDLRRHRRPDAVQNAFERELLHVTVSCSYGRSTHARRSSPHDHNSKSRVSRDSGSSDLREKRVSDQFIIIFFFFFQFSVSTAVSNKKRNIMNYKNDDVC